MVQKSEQAIQSDYKIEVKVSTCYLPEQSVPEEDRFAFRYSITISNNGDHAARLLARHWVITDGNGHVEQVEGQGVVGEQPLIQPGEEFRYSSGCILPTKVGSMKGRYQLQSEDEELFQTEIPIFSLAVPNALH